MSPLALAFFSLAAMLFCTIIGMALATKLREHHLNLASLEIVKASRYVLIGLVALTLSLLISSAKNSFEETAKELRIQASQFVLLDSMLEAYGLGGKKARSSLLQYLKDEIFRLDIASEKGEHDVMAANLGNGSESLKRDILSLEIRNETDFLLKAKLLETGLNIISTRWKIFVDIDDDSDNHLLLALIFWSSAIFFSLGLISPKNSVTFASLSFSIICTAYAVFLIAELDSPYKGIFTVTSASLRSAIEQINR